MPRSAPHPCHSPGCPNLVQSGSFCDDHKPQRHQQYDANRGSSTARGYGARWRKLRDSFLRTYPLCADPDQRHAGQVRPATDVDHIVARAQGGHDTWENLQSLCHECHSAKTVAENGGFGNAQRVTGGGAC